jgi:hypothetical protein
MLAVGKVRRLRTLSQAILEPRHRMITCRMDLALRRIGLI